MFTCVSYLLSLRVMLGSVAKENSQKKRWQPGVPWEAEHGDSFIIRSNYFMNVRLVIFCAE